LLEELLNQAEDRVRMSDREPPEKRTVERSDELLQKSRRLIDELEFILDRLNREPRRPEHKDRPSRGERGEDARSD
jgi:hypothetical protein